ncbi:MAG: threonine aldolase [Chloroflexi bacterium RBG_13_60_13]|nr:MAG: threonine aldolase [Chloroflexi bacterium RBG_13_60_13]
MTTKAIELRSDTFTLPSPEMRRAIAEAELGDDVFREDPTVNRLEVMAAERLGKEAALLTASGTMSNLVALLSHCQRGDEVLLGSEAHILHFEAVGGAALGGLELRPLPNDRCGYIDAAAIEEAVRPPDVHFPHTGLLCLENTHNRCGGTVLSEADMQAMAQVARRWGFPVHLDGARVFNAAVALGVPVADLVRPVDSVAFSLCKGLACPVGSVLCGSAEFIQRARRYRKMVGGGMRQAGIIAAAGIVALESMIDRLAEDHENARLLAQGLAAVPGLRLVPPQVDSNMVFFTLDGVNAFELASRLSQAKVLCLAEAGRVRLVTHYGIERADVEEAVERIRATVGALA